MIKSCLFLIEHGKCNNCNGDKNCLCEKGYTKHPVQKTCICHENLCKVNKDGKICSGNGKCDCNKCNCFVSYNLLFDMFKLTI